jgi:PhnB protein
MDDQVSLNVYLFFGGQCQEAMEFYKGVFGGELTTTTRGSVDKEAPDDMKNLLIHANLEGGLAHLMGSDWTESSISPQKRVSVSLNGKNEELLRKVYDDLSAGGKADQPLKKEFWGDIFGGLTDKYGISWLVNIEAEKAA